MGQLVATGTVEAFQLNGSQPQGAALSDKNAAHNFTITVQTDKGPKTLENVFGGVADEVGTDVGSIQGKNVAVWDNNGSHFIVLDKNNKNTKSNGTKNTYSSSQKTTGTSRGTATGRSSDQQASIVAQNAFNRGVEIVSIAAQATAKAIELGTTGVTKTSIKPFTDPDWVAEQALHYASMIHPILMSGDLTQELPKFDKTEDSSEE